MYLSEYADRIRRLVPAELLPADDTEDLFRSYAVLLLAKGSEVTLPDVHNAWAGWMSGRNPDHPSLVPFEKLAPETARQDEPFLTAIQKVAAERAGGVDLDAYLFPNGRNPRRYRLFTAREIWVPYLATAVYAIAAVVELLVVTNLWSPS